jgi:hypothetical protein
MNKPPVAWNPKPWGKFRVDQNFRNSWKDYIPVHFKNKIKSIVKG